MREFFVTGTDTGIGKTTVSVALLAAAAHRGLRSVGMKPAETGCELVEGQLVPADGQRLQQAASVPLSLDSVCPYRFAEPVAPAVAAEAANTLIDVDRLSLLWDAHRASSPDIILAEGAGGLLVPLTPTQTMADLASRLGAPLLIVARASLGTINHTLLTIEAAQHRNLPLAGFILSDAANTVSRPFAESNAHEIERISAVPCLGILPFVPAIAPQDLAAAAEQHLSLTALLP